MPIQLIFLDHAIRDLCERQAIAHATLGPEEARRLRSRIADLHAATSVVDVPAGRPTHAADGSGNISYALGFGTHLVVEPADNPIPRDAHGAIDWSKVTKVRVIYVGQKQ